MFLSYLSDNEYQPTGRVTRVLFVQYKCHGIEIDFSYLIPPGGVHWNRYRNERDGVNNSQPNRDSDIWHIGAWVPGLAWWWLIADIDEAGTDFNVWTDTGGKYSNHHFHHESGIKNLSWLVNHLWLLPLSEWLAYNHTYSKLFWLCWLLPLSCFPHVLHQHLQQTTLPWHCHLQAHSGAWKFVYVFIRSKKSSWENHPACYPFNILDYDWMGYILQRG